MKTMKMLLSLMALGVALTLSQTAFAARYGDADLDQMLAPIALYPDSVLSHVLIAATYPLEVAQAARWSRTHASLHGEEAVDAVEDRDWDASVKSLVAFPEILARMDDDLDWTERLGEAFLEQEGDVMDRVQFLRARAYDNGHLESMEHVHVIRERETIYIEPAITEVLYVPYYDPWFVYGSWWWPSYPPYCWRVWYGRPASYYGSGFYWGIGFRVAPTFYFTSFYWPERHVVVSRNPHRPFYSGRDVVHHDDFRAWRRQPDRVPGMHYHREPRPPHPDVEAPHRQPRDPHPVHRREPWDERIEAREHRDERGRSTRHEFREEPRGETSDARAGRNDQGRWRAEPPERAGHSGRAEPPQEHVERHGNSEESPGRGRGRAEHGRPDNPGDQRQSRRQH